SSGGGGRLAVPCGRTEGFHFGRTANPQLPASSAREPRVSESAQAAGSAAGSPRPPPARFFALEAGEPLGFFPRERQGHHNAAFSAISFDQRLCRNCSPAARGHRHRRASAPRSSGAAAKRTARRGDAEMAAANVGKSGHGNSFALLGSIVGSIQRVNRS